MKTVGWIVLIILAAILGTLGYLAWRGKEIYDKTEWDFKFDGSIQDLIKALATSIGKPSIVAPVKMIIDSDLNKKIDLSKIEDIKVQIYYKGQLIAVTPNPLPPINVPANAKGYEIKSTVELFKVPETQSLLSEIFAGRAPEVETLITGNYFGVPINPTMYRIKHTIEP